MGLFNFIKDTGEKIIRTEERAEKDIKARIEADNPGVSDLSVQYWKDRGLVRLSGKAESAEAREKAILIAGNVEGVETVEADKLTAPAPEQDSKVDYYEIQSGDTLSKLAQQYYGDPMKYPVLFEANREVILDPDKIYPGQKIRIPLA